MLNHSQLKEPKHQAKMSIALSECVRYAFLVGLLSFTDIIVQRDFDCKNIPTNSNKKPTGKSTVPIPR